MIFRHIWWRLRKKSRDAPVRPEALPWSDIVEECHDQQLGFHYPIVKILHTDDRAGRAVLLQRKDNLYTVAFETLYPFDEDELRHAGSGLHGYWAPDTRSMNSLFDTAEEAERYILTEPPFRPAGRGQ